MSLVASTYELALLTAAVAGGSRRQNAAAQGTGPRPRLAVVVPAHDEAATLDRILGALEHVDYPPDRYEVVVVADNCTDSTAAIARRAGATVWERNAPASPGKGRALAWAIERLRRERPEVDGVAFVDADCEPSQNFLAVLGAALRAGHRIVQADYTVANPGASRRAALRFAAFAVVNTMRPRGKTSLGLSAGLLGTGMAFSIEVLARVPWDAESLVEDRDQHLLLVAAGERVVFVPEASVTSPMPTDAANAATQETRWEAGRLDLVRHRLPELARTAARRRDARLAAAVVDELVPPRSALVTVAAAAAAVGALAGAPGAVRLAAATALAQATVVLGSLALARAPRSVYAALLSAPAYAAARSRLLARVAANGQPREWVRTSRSPG